MHLDTYADYLRQVEPRTESRAVRALLITGGPRIKKLYGRCKEVSRTVSRLGRNGLHEGRSNSDESPTGCSQSRGDIRSRKNNNNGPPMGGRNLWMSFLVVENLDNADQFILGRDFVRNFDVMIVLNNGLIRIRNPDRKYVKQPINRLRTDEYKVHFFQTEK